MKLIKTQFRIMINKRGFQVSFTMMMLFVVFCFIEGFYLCSVDKNRNYDIANLQSADFSFLNESHEQRFQTFVFFFPFLVVLPFSFSLFIDRSTRIREIVITRCSRKEYYYSKLITAFLGGFIIIFIPLIISTVLSHCFYSHSVINLFDPNYSTLTAGEKDFLSMRDLLLELLVFSPVMGEIAAAFFLSVYAGTCAMFALSVSGIIKRFSVLIFLPVFLLTKLFDLGQSMIKSAYDYTYFNIDPMKYVIISSDNPIYGRPYWLFALEMAAMILISVLLIHVLSKQDNIG